MRKAGILLLCVAAAGFAQAQTTAFSFTFQGIANGCLQDPTAPDPSCGSVSASGTGVLDPFGPATMTFTAIGDNTAPQVTFVFTLASGGSFTANSTSASAGGDNLSGQASIASGSGIFAGVSGTFSFSGTAAPEVPPVPVTITGSGTINGIATEVINAPLVCDGGGAGGSAPIYRRGPAPSLVSPSDATTPGNCQVIICDGGGLGSGTPIYRRGSSVPAGSPAAGPCETVDLTLSDGAGGTLPILVFGGAGGSAPILFPTGSGGDQGSPIVTYDSSGNPVFLFLADGGGSGGGAPIDRPCKNCAASAAAATNSKPVPVAILTPLQTTAASYKATAVCSDLPSGVSGGCWITLAAPAGTIAASSRAGITANINPSGLPPGTYSGSVAIAITPQNGQPATSVNVPLDIQITTETPPLAAGLQFQAVAGAAEPPAQSLWVSGFGLASQEFSASASTLSGGNWLSVSPASGTGLFTSPAHLTVQANPAGLAPGAYSGRVTIASTAAGGNAGSQSVEVAFTVLPSTAKPAPAVSSTALVFVAQGSDPAPQTVNVSNLSSQALTVSTQTAYANGTGWLSAKASASMATSSAPVTETVSVNASGLAPGAYIGTLDIHAAETNSDLPVEVVLVVRGASCTPKQLIPAFTNLEGAFQRTAGLPVALEAQIVDDCGTPVSAGSAVAYFSNSDAPAVLLPVGNGHWAGSWAPHQLAGGSATAGIVAASDSGLYGSSGVMGTLAANSAVPRIDAGGAVSAASFASGSKIAPGEFLSIFGKNFGAGIVQSNGLPYPPILGGAQVWLGGKPLPLELTASGQINAVVPYDVPVDTVAPLVVEQGGSYSLPETVRVIAAHPGVFTQDQSGKGAGAIMVVKPDGTQFLNAPSAPASVGDALVIYCTGLGQVDQAVEAGSAAPASLSQTTATVTATVGGQPAQVFFSGLTPGYAGLYQVNVIVPSGVTPGANVPVVLAEAGASSPEVTVAIR